MATVGKNFSNSYLYNKMIDYERNIFKFIMEGERIDTSSEQFEDIVYDVKRRQVSSCLLKVLTSKFVVLLTSPNQISKSFKVMCLKDPKEGGVTKIFVDVSSLIKFDNGKYKCTNIDILIAYLVSAMQQRIYYTDASKFVNNTNVNRVGCDIFISLVNYVIDYLYKVNSIPGNRQTLEYITYCYYQVNILGKELDENIKNAAAKSSGISIREKDILDIRTSENSFINIKEFIETVSKILRYDKLTLDIFIEKWMFLYNPGTQFAVELFPAFSSMITDAFVGCYINNQKTIEKIVGRDLVTFATAILNIGADCING